MTKFSRVFCKIWAGFLFYPTLIAAISLEKWPQSRDPFKASASAVVHKLNDCPLNAIVFLGVIQHSLKIWAFLQCEKGEVVAVEEGEYIANENLKLTIIKPNVIFLEDKLKSTEGHIVTQLTLREA